MLATQGKVRFRDCDGKCIALTGDLGPITQDRERRSRSNLFRPYNVETVRFIGQPGKVSTGASITVGRKKFIVDRVDSRCGLMVVEAWRVEFEKCFLRKVDVFAAPPTSSQCESCCVHPARKVLGGLCLGLIPRSANEASQDGRSHWAFDYRVYFHPVWLDFLTRHSPPVWIWDGSSSYDIKSFGDLGGSRTAPYADLAKSARRPVSSCNNCTEELGECQ